MPEAEHRRFLRYFLECQGLIKAYLLSSTGDVDVSDDLFQEVSAVLWEKFDRYDESRPFRAWALGIARMQCLIRRRDLARSREILSEETLDFIEDAALSSADEIDERSRYVRLCVEELGETARGVVEMRYAESMKIAQIAGRMRRSVASIEMMLVRIRRSLKKCIEWNMGEDTEVTL